MNNKGFTLIELLISIMLLAIITSVTTVVVVNVLDSSKERSYDLIVSSAKIGAQQFFEECENRNIIETKLPDSVCNRFDNDSSCEGTNAKKCAFITFGELLQYGFIKSSDGIQMLENPKTNDDMRDCRLKITKFIDSNYSTWYKVESDSNYSYCPTDEEYAK